ncbi:hypothetical protein EPR50_G00155100, partial [Perca flavescens]
LKHHTIPSYPNPAHPRFLPPSSFISPSLSLSPLHLTSSQPEQPPILLAQPACSRPLSLSLHNSYSLRCLLSFICFLSLSVSFSLSVLHFSPAGRSPLLFLQLLRIQKHSGRRPCHWSQDGNEQHPQR